MLTAKKEKISLVAVFASVAIIINPISAITIAGRGILVYVFFLFSIAFLSQRQRTHWTPILTSIVVLLGYNLFGLLWGTSPDPTRLLQVLWIIIIFGSFVFNDTEQKLIQRGCVVEMLITCYLVYVSSVSTAADGRASISFLGVDRDPNYVSLMCLPGVAVLSKKAMSLSKGSSRILGIALLLFVLFTELRMGSRGGLFSCILIIGLSFVLYRRISVRSIVLVVIVLWLTYLVLPVVMDYLPDIVADRFSKEKLKSDQFGDRFWIWHKIYSFMFDDFSVPHFLFGYGTSSTISYIGAAAHNFILQYFFEGGIVSLVLVFSFIINFVKISVKSKSYLSLIVFLSSFFMALSLSISGILEFWFNIAVAFAMLSHSAEVNK